MVDTSGWARWFPIRSSRHGYRREGEPDDFWLVIYDHLDDNGDPVEELARFRDRAEIIRWACENVWEIPAKE